ncbi:MAG: hypothetical protein ACI4QD_08855 [Kiritimatiellia bacterium]
MNAGFSAAAGKNIFGTIAGLSPKTFSDGKTSQVAECPDEYGDTAAHDVFGEVIAPSVEFVVTAAISKSTTLCVLGSIHSVEIGGVTKKVMLTICAITTSANNPPTVSLSGVEVEAGATAKRTYAVNVDLLPRSKAQDVAGAFTASSKFTQITTTFSVDPHVQTVSGVPVASDASHGKVEVAATMTDGDGTGTITAADAGGFTVTAVPAESDPDANYITRTATATKFLAGTEATTANAAA